MTDQQERDARLGLRALAALGSIPPGPPPASGEITIWCATCGANLGTDRGGLPAGAAEHVCYPGVTVALTGGDGNVFAVIGAVARALTLAERRRAVPADAGGKWTVAALACKSYDEVLRLALRTVAVE